MEGQSGRNFFIQLPAPSSFQKNYPEFKAIIKKHIDFEGLGVNRKSLEGIGKINGIEFKPSPQLHHGVNLENRYFIKLVPAVELVFGLLLYLKNPTLESNFSQLDHLFKKNPRVTKNIKDGKFNKEEALMLIRITSHFFSFASLGMNTIVSNNSLDEDDFDSYVDLNKKIKTINNVFQYGPVGWSSEIQSALEFLFFDINTDFKWVKSIIVVNPKILNGIGDYVLDNYIFDIKSSASQRSFKLKMLEQVALYFIYDRLNDRLSSKSFGLKGIGLFNPILNNYLRIDLYKVLGHDRIDKLTSEIIECILDTRNLKKQLISDLESYVSNLDYLLDSKESVENNENQSLSKVSEIIEKRLRSSNHDIVKNVMNMTYELEERT